MKAFKVALLAAVAVLAGFLFHRPLLRAVRGFLVIAEEPARADAVVVFCGGGGERIRYGLRLFQEGFAERILFCGTDDEALFVRNILKGEGWDPPESVEVHGGLATTYESLRYVKKWAARKGIRVFLAVSSPTHMRRVRLLCGRVFRGSPPVAVLCPVPEEEGGEWWRSAAGRRAVWLEWKKLLWSRFSYWR